MDRDDYRTLDRSLFLRNLSPVTPESPTLRLQVLSNTTYEYSEKVLAQRTIQDYRIKPGFLVLGMIGAGLAAYAANSNTITGGSSSAATISLNTAAVLLAGSGLMNMEPTGSPRPTGEERFLRKTGVLVQQDTLQVDDTPTQSAKVSVRYGEEELINSENRSIDGGELAINLGGLLSGLDIQGLNTNVVGVEVVYRDSTYNFNYSLDEVLQPYALITAPVAELRSKPEESTDNILAELIEGSQLQILEYAGLEWYKILYGISENYISQDDAELIWRTSDFSDVSEILAVPVVPFGNIDVENNIPILSGINPNARGLVVTNEGYGRPFSARSHAHRDGQLIDAYMENALGLEQQNIFHLEDISNGQSLFNTLNSISEEANDSTELIIYLSGYGEAIKENNGFNISFIPVTQNQMTSDNNGSIYLSEIFERIAAIPAGKVLVLADIEFQHSSDDVEVTESEIDIYQPLREISGIITDENPNAAVIFSSQINEGSELYVSDRGEDKKHHLFPYFFGKALQQRITNVGAIYQYLQRNVPYTARRLHDRSQDPQVYGNTSMQLVPNR